MLAACQRYARTCRPTYTEKGRRNGDETESDDNADANAAPPRPARGSTSRAAGAARHTPPTERASQKTDGEAAVRNVFLCLPSLGTPAKSAQVGNGEPCKEDKNPASREDGVRFGKRSRTQHVESTEDDVVSFPEMSSERSDGAHESDDDDSDRKRTGI